MDLAAVPTADLLALRAVTLKAAKPIRITSGGPKRDASLDPIIARVKADLIALAYGDVQKYNQNHDERGRFATADGSGGGTAIANAEAANWRATTEHLTVVGPDGRVVFTKHDANDHQVEVTDALEAKMAGTTFTHNHPFGWTFPAGDPRHAGNAPSSDDLKLAITGKAASMRVTTPDSLYVVTPPGGRSQFGPEDVSVLANLLTNNVGVRADFTYAIGQGTMTIPQAEAAHWNEVWTRTAAATGVGYSKAPYNGGV